MLVNGKPYEACNRAAGEIGAFLTVGNRRAEDDIAMEGLLQRVSQTFANNGRQTGTLTFEQVVDWSLASDALVTQCLRELGRELGIVIYNCSVMLDIPTIIFGGDYIKLGPALFKGVKETINQSFLPFRPVVIKSSLGETGGLYGGLAIGKDRLLQSVSM